MATDAIKPRQTLKPGHDLQALTSLDLDWDDDNRKLSLAAVCQRAEDHALNAIDWYLHAKNAKKKCAQFLRLGVIGASAIAGALPLFTQIFPGQLATFSPAWTTVALGVAGVLMAIDKFFGCSNAWMRFITYEHRIRQALHEFQMDYDISQSQWANDLPTPEQAQDMLGRCKIFISLVDTFILQETNEWLDEFKNAIKQKDDVSISKT